MVPVLPYYEVEIRFHFRDHSGVHEVLPFLRPFWQQEAEAFDTYYGLKLFQTGQVLRISKVFVEKGERYYLAWKGENIGRFANIRFI